MNLEALRTAPFALLRREGRCDVEVLAGAVTTVDRLADISLPTGTPDEAISDVLALVPYRQVAERGFACVDDGAPLSCMRITSATRIAEDALLAALPTGPVRLVGGAFDLDDEAYGQIVHAVLTGEIGCGEGANFVLHRVFEGALEGDPLDAALAVFARLLRDERGAYWTFLVHTGDRTLVGATPERHVSVDNGLILMNPISGTYRHPSTGADLDGLLRFLAETKEADELYMVLDEELKMMATVAERGGQALGPYLKQMTHVTHTEYLLAGRTSLDVRDVLRETMFAPTVVGSPIENACRVIARHERPGRGYYGAVLALLGRDAAGQQTLDAPILIRTAEISPHGRVRVPIGATLVRDSTPEGEVAETHAKAAGVLTALGLLDGPLDGVRADPARDAVPAPSIAENPLVLAALADRNATLAPFWLLDRSPVDPVFERVSALVVDAEDTFTGMLGHLLRALGVQVTRRSYQDVPAGVGFDLVIAGPGPGDPGDRSDPKVAVLEALIVERLEAGLPLLAICLSHQILAAILGLAMRRKDSPYQGVQRAIDLFGQSALVGFYSTFTAVADCDEVVTPYGVVELSRDSDSGEIHALRGNGFVGMQFHPESVLSQFGIEILRDALHYLVGEQAATKPATRSALPSH